MGAIERISHALQFAITKGAVVRTDDSPGAQRVETKGLGGWADWADVFYPYGFRSHAKSGAEAILCRLGAVGELIALVVFDRRYRITLVEGEVAIFDDQGQKIHLKRTGIDVAAKSGAKIALKNDVDVTGTANATAGFAFNGSDGKTGILTITIAGPGATPGVATLLIAGGIITNVTVTGSCEWVEI